MDAKIPMVTADVRHPVAGSDETGAGKQPVRKGKFHHHSSKYDKCHPGKSGMA
jgi:hypothetical protein